MDRLIWIVYLDNECTSCSIKKRNTQLAGVSLICDRFSTVFGRCNIFESFSWILQFLIYILRSSFPGFLNLDLTSCSIVNSNVRYCVAVL